MHWLAKVKRWRRGTYRYEQQLKLIDNWLDGVSSAMEDSYQYALAVARCIEIVKGYGDTYHRGLTRYQQSIAAMNRVTTADKATALNQLRTAASADEQGQVFADAIESIGASK